MNLLDKVVDLEHQASKLGMQWQATDQIMDQIHSECAEINHHLVKNPADINRNELQEEIGDLLHAVFSLCVFCQLSPQDTLARTLTKFERRLHAVQAIAQEQGLTDLKGYSFDDLMTIWRQAKKRVG